MTSAHKPVYLFIVPFFPSENRHWGSYIYDQVKAVQASGRYEVAVVRSSTDLDRDGDYEFGGVEIRRFRERNLYSALWNGFFDKSNCRNLDDCLDKNHISLSRIAVVHAHTIRTGIYAVHLKNRNPHILSILQHHGYDVLGITDGRFSKFEWHKRHAVKYGTDICNHIDLHVGVSKATLTYLHKYPGICVKDEYVLYNGVDTDKFHPLTKYPNNRFTIGCVANFWKVKDHITLIKAVECLVNEYSCDIRAKLIGTGATLEECKTYVTSHNLSGYIEFLPHLAHGRMIEFYNSIDLFVLPSYWDTLGCVYLESFACGVPFMTAEGTGVQELIPDNEKSLWIAPKSDYRRLALMIKDYMDNLPAQHLSQSTDIKSLIWDFLDFIDAKLRQRL